MWHLWAGYVWHLWKSHWETPETETKSHFLYSARAALTSKQPRLYSNSRRKLQAEQFLRGYSRSRRIGCEARIPRRRGHARPRVATQHGSQWKPRHPECAGSTQETSVVINATASLAGLAVIYSRDLFPTAMIRFFCQIDWDYRHVCSH